MLVKIYLVMKIFLPMNCNFGALNTFQITLGNFFGKNNSAFLPIMSVEFNKGRIM